MESGTNKQQDKDINSKVSWSVFIGVISIFTVAFGWLIMATNTTTQKADLAIERISSVEGDIKAINVKLTTISQDIRDIKDWVKRGELSNR